MKFKFQSFFDVSTSASSMQIIQWSVGGKDVLDRCRHLFGAYKYFKLGKISVKMVPASTLPVDPQGLSYAEDDPQTVDPRDQMTPGLIRITNGEDIFINVSRLNESQQENMFNAMMLDPRWSKFMLQSGFRRSAYPLYWQVGQLSQDKFPGSTVNVPWLNVSQNGFNTDIADGNGVIAEHLAARVTSGGDSSISGVSITSGSSMRGLFQTGHRGRLGFLPTDYFQEIVNTNGVSFENTGANNIPEISVITCVLPKAHKTLYYYRVFITEEVIFSGLRSSPPGGLLGIDQFIYGSTTAYLPGVGIGINPVSLSPQNNGEVKK